MVRKLIYAAALFGLVAARPCVGIAAPQPIVVPVLSSQTGPAAVYGENNVIAMRMAADALNKAGGIGGHPLELLVQDTQSSPAQAAILVRKDAANYLVALGPNLSNDAKAAFPVAVREGFPMVSSGISDVRIMEANRPWTFSTFIPAQVIAPNAADTWIKLKHPKTIVTIINRQDDACAIQGQLVQDKAKQDGAKILKVITVSSGQVDYSAEVAVIKSLHPGGIIISDLPADLGALVKELDQAGVHAPILLTMIGFTPDFMKIAGSSARDVTTFTQFWAGMKDANVRAFTTEYLKRSNNVPPGLSSASSYDAVMLLAQAMNRAGLTTVKGSDMEADRKKLVQALQATHVFKGVLQEYGISSGGYRTGNGFLLQIRNGAVSEDR